MAQPENSGGRRNTATIRRISTKHRSQRTRQYSLQRPTLFLVLSKTKAT